MGPTHKPNPAATPVRSLSETGQDAEVAVPMLNAAYLPIIRGGSVADTAMKPAPTAITKALARHAPLRPQRSMTTFAPRLPSRPPTVYTEVRTEKVASSMAMHVGRP